MTEFPSSCQKVMLSYQLTTQELSNLEHLLEVLIFQCTRRIHLLLHQSQSKSYHKKFRVQIVSSCMQWMMELTFLSLVNNCKYILILLFTLFEGFWSSFFSSIQSLIRRPHGWSVRRRTPTR